MQIRELTQEVLNNCAREAGDVLKAGGVIIFPTDTLYGLGADALSDEAVDKIYEIKGREEKKPIHAIAADITMMEIYGVLNDAGRALAERFFPGPITLILEKRAEFETGIARDIETIGFRIPRNEFCVRAARAFGRPYTATSANKAGQEPRRTLGPILAQLGAAISLIDLAFDGGELSDRKPSTVVDVSSGEIKILREGAVLASEIQRVPIL